MVEKMMKLAWAQGWGRGCWGGSRVTGRRASMEGSRRMDVWVGGQSEQTSNQYVAGRVRVSVIGACGVCAPVQQDVHRHNLQSHWLALCGHGATSMYNGTDRAICGEPGQVEEGQQHGRDQGEWRYGRDGGMAVRVITSEWPQEWVWVGWGWRCQESQSRGPVAWKEPA